MRNRKRLRTFSSFTHRDQRRLRLEDLEARRLLSAAGVFTTDYVMMPLAGTSTTSGYTPQQIRTAYGFNSLGGFGATPADGRGQTIAIIDAYNDPNIAADLAVFDSAYGIAAPPSLKIVNQTGGTALPGADPSQGWEGETALDVEWAHAIAPGANILLVEANNASDSNLFAAVNYARQQTAVSVISMSWGSDDNPANAANDQSLSNQYLVTPAGHQGITFVASSGDDGHPNFPAESPNVLAVGGTDLYLNSNGTISSETAWTPQSSGGMVWSGSGGVSQEFAGRDVPDVAYNAGVGIAVYDTFGPDHGWVSVGGTSAGAPQWSALVAIADEGRAISGLGTLNGATQTRAALFAAPATDFHDITQGKTQFQSAGVGYDLATGLGTPAANLLVPYLAAYGGGSGTTNPSAPAAPGNFTATAGSATQVNLNWTLSAGATGYDVYELESGGAVLLGTLGSTATSDAVSGLTASTTYNFEVAASNSTGITATSWTPVTTKAAPAVTAPTGVKASAANSTTATVAWNTVANATGYYVYEVSGGKTTQVANAVGATASSATIGGLTPGSTVSFYVTAYNATSSAASASVNLTLPAATTGTLAAPTNVVATATSATTGTLSWTGSANATGYAIYYWNGNRAVLLGTVGSSTTSVSITGLSANSTYSFYVAAFNSKQTAASNWVTLTTPAVAATKSSRTVAADAMYGGEWWWYE